MTNTTFDRENLSENIDRILEAGVALGAAWAHHGLTLGRSALEVSAKTLESTAAMLGGIAASLESVAGARRTEGSREAPPDETI